MPKYEIAIEYKNRHLTRPQLQQIIGAAISIRPDVDEIIIRCRTAAGTAWAAAEDIAESGSILNSKGRRVKITLAVNSRKD